MTKRIRPYNYSYKYAYRILKETPATTLAFLVIRVINELNPEHNYSKEGVRRAWDDFRAMYDKPSRQVSDAWSWPTIGCTDMLKIVEKHRNTPVDEINDD